MPRSTRLMLLLASGLALGPTLAVLAATFAPVEGWIDRYGYVIGRDFSNFWFAARLALAGETARIYDLDAFDALRAAAFATPDRFMNFSYMPNALPLLMPLGLLPYGAALALWSLAGLGALAALVWHGRGTPGDRAFVLAALILSPAVLLNLAIGQAALFWAFLLVMGFRLVDTRPLLAGLLFGLLTLKPHLGLLVPVVLLVQRRWLAIAAAEGVAALLVLASIALFGPASWHDYLAVTVPYQARVVMEPFGFVWSMLTSPYGWFAKLGLDPAMALRVHAVLAVGIAVAATWAALRAPAALGIAALATGAVLVVPYALTYDLAVPAAAVAMWLLARREPLPPLALAAIAGFWAMPVLAMVLYVMGVYIAAPLTFALFAVLARLAMAPAGARAGAIRTA